MKIYAIADTHFGHDPNIVKREVGFEKKILKSVSQNHGNLLIHCGDFCIGNDELHHRRFMEAVGGFNKKILVRGNHDRKSDNWYVSQGWDFVTISHVADYFGKRIIFTHVPVEMSAGYWSINPPTLNVHGHYHGNDHRNTEPYASSRYYDLAPDLHGMGMVNLRNVIEKYDQKKVDQNKFDRRKHKT